MIATVLAAWFLLSPLFAILAGNICRNPQGTH